MSSSSSTPSAAGAPLVLRVEAPPPSAASGGGSSPTAKVQPSLLAADDDEDGTDSPSRASPPTWRNPPPSHHPDDCFHRCLRRHYFPFLVRFAKPLLVFWLGLFVLCIIVGPKWFGLTRANLDLPTDTPSARAVTAFTDLYPDTSSWPPAFIVQSAEGATTTVLTEHTRNLSARIQAFVAAGHTDAVSGVSGYWELSSVPSLAILAERAVSPSNRTLVTSIYFKKEVDIERINEFADDVIAFTNSISAPGNVRVAATGIFLLFRQMSLTTETNFALIDAVVLPIAIVILGARVRSYRHMLVAIATLAGALLLCFTILVPISQPDVFDINPFMPSVVLSLGIAVCFDYALFMLSRFREERTVQCKGKEDATFASLVAAGHVVMLSGATLAFTFVILIAFPQNFLQSVGYSCSIVVITSMFSSMTLIPALLLTFECLSHFELLPSRTSCCCRIPRTDSAVAARAELDRLAASPEAIARRAAQVESAKTARGLDVARTRADMWFTVPWALTLPRIRWAVLAVAIAITIPFITTVTRLLPTSDDALVYEQGSSSLEAMKTMKRDFPPGQQDAYQVIVDAKAVGTGSVFTPTYFAFESALVATLLASNTKYVDARSFSALSFFNAQPVTFMDALAYMNASSPQYNTPFASAYRIMVLAQKPNAAQSASLITIETTEEPNSEAITPFVVKTREILGDVEKAAAGTSLPVRLHLFGAYTTTYDVQKALYALVPVDIGIVLLIVLVIVGGSFSSLALVLRLLLTLAMSLVWVYGLAVLVYQPGKAQDDFSVITPTLLSSTGIYWIIPVMTFSILVGLALDYDVFLLSRMVEYRAAGWSDRAAICLSVSQTGSVITAAGLIMAISFFGLLIPPVVVLNQYGFCLTMGVIFDAFVIRPVVVPAVVAIIAQVLGPQGGWWPRRMPVPVLTPEEEEQALAAGCWWPHEFKPELLLLAAGGGGGGGGNGGAGKEGAGEVVEVVEVAPTQQQQESAAAAAAAAVAQLQRSRETH